MESAYRSVSARLPRALQLPQARFGVMLGAIFLAELSLMLAADQDMYRRKQAPKAGAPDDQP